MSCLLGKYPRVESWVHQFSSSCRTATVISTAAVQACILPSCAWVFPLLPTLASMGCHLCFDLNRSDRCKMESQSSFDLHFPDDEGCWTLVSQPMCFLFWEFFLDLYPTLNGIFVFLISSYLSSLYTLDISLLLDVVGRRLFPSCRLPLCPIDSILCHAEDFQFH